MDITIYTSGPMDNINEDEAINWRKYVRSFLHQHCKVYVPIYDSIEDNGNEVWSRNYFMLDRSDVILVNLDYSNTRPFLGLSLEMGRAYFQHKPIVIFSNYDWVHENKTLQHHAAKILRTLDEAIEYIKLNYC
jgi:nucleoside 2-deoxyribosyltransferase